MAPFSSEKQRRFLWAKHPDVAEAWAHGKSSVTGKKESGRKKHMGHAIRELRKKGYK